MKFTPKTEEEIQKESSKFGPWPNGVYDFEVFEAEDKTSKNGNDMLVLTLHIFNPDGHRRTVYDYLLENIPHKLKHAAEACGLHRQYTSGSLDKDDFYGKTGRLKLGIQPERDGYPAKNVVRDYLPAKPVNGAAVSAPVSRKVDLDDEIPF